MRTPVPSFTHDLKSMSKFLTVAEAHCETRKIDPSVMIYARLFPDMPHLIANVRMACDTAKGLAARLSQTDNPVFADDEATFDDLQARITKTIEFMKSVPAAGFEGAEERDITMKFGPQEMTFSGERYFDGFATPNFYFHMTTVYAILRHNGVELGKRDFLGAT
jgi:hypothetical protein